MNIRRELIAEALRKRFMELCSDRISHLGQPKFTGVEQYISEVRERFQDAQPEKVKNCFDAPGAWMASDNDCLTSLQSLSLGQPLRCHLGKHPPTDSFITILSEARDDPEASFRLLVERYACPANFTLPGEVAVREYVLTRLMVHSRARIEKHGALGANVDDLLKLNLVAVYAALTTDLRFLDVLNYYYELLPSTWYPTSGHNWLLVSYLALYARALAYLSEAITECE